MSTQTVTKYHCVATLLAQDAEGYDVRMLTINEELEMPSQMTRAEILGSLLDESAKANPWAAVVHAVCFELDPKR